MFALFIKLKKRHISYAAQYEESNQAARDVFVVWFGVHWNECLDVT